MRRLCLFASVTVLLGLAGPACAQYAQPYPYGYPQAPSNYPYPQGYYPNRGYAPAQPSYYYAAQPSYQAPAYRYAQPAYPSQTYVGQTQGQTQPPPVMSVQPAQPENVLRAWPPQPLPAGAATTEQMLPEGTIVLPGPGEGKVVPEGPAPTGRHPRFALKEEQHGAPLFQLQQDSPCGYRVWGSVDYLFWWVKNGPPNFPLVTTDTVPGTITSGTLASPTVGTLFGPSGFNFSSFNGARATLGVWVDDDRRFGLEGSGFALERKSAGFSAGSNAAGSPPIYLPFLDATTGQEGRVIVSDPIAGFAGSVSISSTLQLWGAEFNLVYKMLRCQGLSLELLGGMRYVNLSETFQLQNTTTDALGVVTSLQDRFETRNQFVGGQLGGRLDYTCKVLTFGVTGKVALGNNHEVSTIGGNITQTGLGTFPGGFLAQPSNSGQLSADRFSVIPQVGVMMKLEMTRCLSLRLGYDLMYWSGVARPGDQIDRSLNLTQSPVFGTGIITGAQRPQASINNSDFWAHGASVGLEFRF